MLFGAIHITPRGQFEQNCFMNLQDLTPRAQRFFPFHTSLLLCSN